MTAKAVEAIKVYLNRTMPNDAHGNVGDVWDAKHVQDLVVFPDTQNARCSIKGMIYCCTYGGYMPIVAAQQQWETGGEFPCEFCGQTFQSAQGLGNHRATKHSGKSSK